MPERYINNLTGDFSICFSEHLTGHPTKVGKDIRLYECKNCVVHAADESKVVVQGLDGYIVAEKNGQLFDCSLKEKQRIKEFNK